MNYRISGNENVLFNNNAFYCIGTGRMGLALQKQYFEQLGKLINSNWEEQVSDILYNLYDDRFLLIQKDFEKVLSDDEEDELVDSCLKELDLDLDLNLDFDFNL